MIRGVGHRPWARARACLRASGREPPEPASFDIFREFFVRFVIFVVKIRSAILNILTIMIIILTTKLTKLTKYAQRRPSGFLLTHNARQTIVGKAIANLRLDWTLAAGPRAQPGTARLRPSLFRRAPLKRSVGPPRGARGGASAGGRVSRPHVAELVCPRLA